MAKIDSRFFVPEGSHPIIEAPWSPIFDPVKESLQVMYLDKDIIPGAFYVDCHWFWPGDWPQHQPAVKPHTHTFDEVLAYFGTNPDDPYDLGGVIEIWIDGKQNITDRTFMAFIPAGTLHGPILRKRIDRPIFHFAVGTGQSYF